MRVRGMPCVSATVMGPLECRGRSKRGVIRRRGRAMWCRAEIPFEICSSLRRLRHGWTARFATATRPSTLRLSVVILADQSLEQCPSQDHPLPSTKRWPPPFSSLCRSAAPNKTHLFRHSRSLFCLGHRRLNLLMMQQRRHEVSIMMGTGHAQPDVCQTSKIQKTRAGGGGVPEQCGTVGRCASEFAELDSVLHG